MRWKGLIEISTMQSYTNYSKLCKKLQGWTDVASKVPRALAYGMCFIHITIVNDDSRVSDAPNCGITSILIGKVIYASKVVNTNLLHFQSVTVHPNSSMFEELPRWVIYFELVPILLNFFLRHRRPWKKKSQSIDIFSNQSDICS